MLGRSLGGAVAAYMATHEDTPISLFQGVILESTFTSINDMADLMVPWPFVMCKPYILDIDWRTIDIVPSLTLPVLYITGDKDELVPY